MNKAFVRETDDDDDEVMGGELTLPLGAKNYITPNGHQALKDELLTLIDVERPAVVQAVSWAAKNGDRSENGDYIYGKKRLREIDKRIYFLTKRLEISEVVDPALRTGEEQVFFGATVQYVNEAGIETAVTIVGVDEIDLEKQRISWRSPIAQALIKCRVGDQVTLHTPGGIEKIEIQKVEYE